VALGACGDDDDDGPGASTTATTTTGPAKTVSVDVAVIPITDLAPFHLGIKRGFFADEKLKVKPRPLPTGGATPVAAVQSGDAQFAWTNTVSLIIARSKGLKLKFVTRGARGGTRPSRSGGSIMVKRDSPVKSLEDLEGKTISVPALQSITTLTTSRALEKQGVDPSKVNFVLVPFPQAIPVLESGRVDAAFVAEPFSTAGARAGHRVISNPLVETSPNYISGAFFATDRYIAENKNVVDRFARAVHKSFDYAAAHPEAMREVIPTFTEIPPKVARRISLPDFSAYTDTSSITLAADLAKKYGYIKDKPNLSELVYQP
jgi:NitT/TauT family transport system substrate-binding protein